MSDACQSATGEFIIRVMTIEDHTEVYDLWMNKPELRVEKSDCRESISSYLSTNSNLSFVALANGCIVGTLLSGSDQKRGYLQHLYVSPEYRHLGIASALLEATLQAFQALGIDELRLFVLRENTLVGKFWDAKGWKRRDDLEVYSYALDNAAEQSLPRKS